MTLNKLRIELDKVASEIEQQMITPVSQQLLALLARYPTAEAIRQASWEELRSVRYAESHRPLPQSFVTRMKELCEHSIAHKKGLGAGLVVQALLKRLEQDRQTITELKRHLPELYAQVKEHPSVLTSIKGITVETAILLEAYIGDVERFPTAKQMVAFFGMNPTVYLSGQSIRRPAHLEKKGSGRVRHKLYMIVLNLIRHRVEPFYGYYRRLVSRGKPKLVAIAATMRKLLVIIYTLLKTRQPFDPNKKS